MSLRKPIRNGAFSGASDAESYACVAALCVLSALPLIGSVALTIWGA
jgi:hypothetical protein